VGGGGATDAGFPTTAGVGGATPTIVPFSFAMLGRACGSRTVGAAAADGTAGVAEGGGGVWLDVPWFIISIVPLNLGAAAPFKLKLHLLQAGADSGFWVPQFGQNTKMTSLDPGREVGA
jgi:hypothetical protein